MHIKAGSKSLPKCRMMAHHFNLKTSNFKDGIINRWTVLFSKLDWQPDSQCRWWLTKDRSTFRRSWGQGQGGNQTVYMMDPDPNHWRDGSKFYVTLPPIMEVENGSLPIWVSFHLGFSTFMMGERVPPFWAMMVIVALYTITYWLLLVNDFILIQMNTR